MAAGRLPSGTGVGAGFVAPRQQCLQLRHLRFCRVARVFCLLPLSFRPLPPQSFLLPLLFRLLPCQLLLLPRLLYSLPCLFRLLPRQLFLLPRLLYLQPLLDLPPPAH